MQKSCVVSLINGRCRVTCWCHTATKWKQKSMNTTLALQSNLSVKIFFSVLEVNTRQNKHNSVFKGFVRHKALSVRLYSFVLIP